MPVVTLTPAFIEGMKAIPGQVHTEYCCDKIRGLFADVHSSAASKPTWNYRFRIKGKLTTGRLGLVQDMPLDEARLQVTLLKTQNALGKAPTGDSAESGLTLDQFMRDQYFPHVREHKRSHWRDEQLYRLRIAERFGHLPLKQITRREVQKFHNELHQKGASKASANHHLQLMRHVLNLAISWEELDRNVLQGVPLFTLDNQVENFLDERQVERLMEVLQTDENRMVCLILVFLLSTGARLREGLCAKWRDVDAARAVWIIPASNSKSKRQKALPLNPSALWAIGQLTSAETSEYLFPSPVTGKPYTTITRVWYRIRKNAGLPGNVRIHDLRHTYASRLVSAGRSLYEVQRLLGHADPRTSMRYAHLSMKTMQEAANAATVVITG